MSMATPIIASFNGGELSPDVSGRVDIDKYFSGCLIAEGFFLLPSGAARGMPGTYYVATGKTLGKKVRMIEFAFSTVQTYMLEFGANYIRFYKDRGQIVVSYAAWQTGTAYPLGYLVTNGGSYYRCIVAHTSGTFATDLAASKWQATAGAADLAYEIPTPYAEADLPYLIFRQSADTMYIVHPSYPPRTLTRSGHTVWTFAVFTTTPALFNVADEYPSCCEFYEQRLMMAATNKRPQTVWGSASALYTTFTLDPADVSKGVEYTIPNRGKVDRIRWMVAQTDINLGTAGNIQKLGPSDGNGLSQTNVKAAAQIGIGCKQIDAILTNDSVVYATKDGMALREVYYDYLSDKYISPPDITLLANHIFKGTSRETSGVVDLAYQQSPVSILWAVRKDGQLCGMTYEKSQKVYGWFRIKMDGCVESVAVISNDDEEDEVWVSVKRTVGGVDYRFIEVFMPHDLYGQIKDAFYVEAGLTFDGGAAKTITGITNANPAVVSCAGHGFSDGQFIKVASVLGMVTVNNTGLNDAYEVESSAAGTFALKDFNSSALPAYTSGGTVQRVAKTVSGLDHLEGESVEIVVDGAHHAALTVASGAITLSWYGNKIHAGLFTPKILAPMPLMAGAQDGTPQGRQKRIGELAIHFVDTYGGSVTPDPDNLSAYETIAFGTGVAPALYSGVKTDINVKANYGPEGKVYIVQTLPLPIQVNAIVAKMVTYD